MVGSIITAREAIRKYPGSARMRQGKVVLKDANCQEVDVDPIQEVYHRRQGCFGIVTDTKDRGKHWSWGHRQKGARNKQHTDSVFGSSDIYDI